MSRSSTIAALIGMTLLARAATAAALDVRVKDVHVPATQVGATIEVRDILPDRFKRLVSDGRVLHLRVQAELWESRPVWDRLVFPAIVRMFRLSRARSGAPLVVTDQAGAAVTYAAVPESMPVEIELGGRDRLTKADRYYVHVVATLGTVADREIDDVNDAVFGRDSESNGLASLGRMVFRTAIEISDYLQSVTAETRSKPAKLAIP
jgi:hypothetical protein